MGTSRQEIQEWFDAGVKQGARYMIVACDTFDWEDYPVYVKARENIAERVRSYELGADMQKLMEVYDLHADPAPQLAALRMRADLNPVKAA